MGHQPAEERSRGESGKGASKANPDPGLIQRISH